MVAPPPSRPVPAPAPADPLPAARGWLAETADSFRARGPERSLLLWNGLLYLLAAWAVAAGQRHPEAVFPEALGHLGTVWGGCLLLHALLCLTRFDGDLLLLPLVSLLFLVGTTLHLDLSGPATSGLSPGPYRQAVLAALVVLALVTAGAGWFRRLSFLFEEKVWWRLAGDRPYYESIPFHLVLIALMGLMAVLLLFGGVPSSGGSLIQVRLPGGFSFTPSEFIRLAVAFFLADYLGRNGRLLRNLRQPVFRVWPLNRVQFERRTELLVVLTTVGLYCLFFYAFRDFGPAAVIVTLTLAALYAATGRVLTPLLLGSGLALAIALPTWRGLAFRTFRNRAEMWLDPWSTDFLNGDHMARILWSISSGGWYGLGLGTQNLPANLPLARNDAAFAAVAAGMGLWVGLAVLFVYAAITWRGMLAARRAPTDRSRLLAFTLTGLLAFQAVWICGAMVRVFPFSGINVPFISTGLSSMLASALALGAIWNLSRTRTQPDPTEASEEVLRGVTRMARPAVLAFALPAAGLIVYGCPWIQGDRTLVRQATSVDRNGERVSFGNPYLERFRRRFGRGRIFSADNRLLAVNNPGRSELEAIRELDPALAERAARNDDPGERYYPLGSSAAQLIGWNAQGRFAAQPGSVEKGWDDLLRGYRPELLPFYFRTRHNPLVPPPQPQDLQLTIRADLQHFAAERLSRTVREWGGSGGALCVYDANTGEVLAAVTAPRFDPNGLTRPRLEELQAEHPRTGILYNKALAREARYFPGSAFKILTAAAALDEAVSGAEECRNGRNAAPIRWDYAGRQWRREPGRVSDYGRGGHGVLRIPQDMDRALAVSCNVYFAGLAARMGPDALRRAMIKAGLSRVPETAALAEYLPYAGFGQIVVRCSPLELAQLTGAFGTALPETPDAAAHPYWVRYVVTRTGRSEPPSLYGGPNRRPFRPFPPEVMQAVRGMMVQAVEDPSGTAHAAFFRGGEPRLPGVTVGGKTGTAEFERPRGESARRGRIGRHAWFIGFARSDHEFQPRTLGIAVLVEDVRRGGTGGNVCAPLAREVFDRILPDPGEAQPEPADMLDRFYASQVRPRLGPLTPLADWIRERLQPNR